MTDVPAIETAPAVVVPPAPPALTRTQRRLAERAQRDAAKVQGKMMQARRQQFEAMARFVTQLARDLLVGGYVQTSDPEAQALAAKSAVSQAVAFMTAVDELDKPPAPSAPVLAPTDANGAPVAE